MQAIHAVWESEGISVGADLGANISGGDLGVDTSFGLAFSLGGPGLIDLGVVVTYGTAADGYFSFNMAADAMAYMANGNLLQRNGTQSTNIAMGFPMAFPFNGTAARAYDGNGDTSWIGGGGGVGGGVASVDSTTRTYSLSRLSAAVLGYLF